MSDGINQVMLMGNLGADAELKTTSVGPVLKFSLATTRAWIDKETNNKKEETVWHRVTIFGRRGEALQKYLTKGTRVFVNGRIHTSSYEKDGQKRYSTDIICEDLHFAGGGDRDRASSPRTPSAAMPSFDGLTASAEAPSENGGYRRRPAQTSIDDVPF